MRILVVADEYPWPERTGYRQRLSWVVRVLSGRGEVDFLAVVLDKGLSYPPPPVEPALTRHQIVRTSVRREPRLRRLHRWVAGSWPRALLWRDWSPAREQVADWADTSYDLVWFSHAGAYLALADLVEAPAVVDLDNLESALLRHRRHNRDRRQRTSVRQRLTGRVHGVADLLDERRWRRLEGHIVDAADMVVVCSDLDRNRLQRPNVVVVPNGYELTRAARTASRKPADAVDSDPVFVMVGLLTYPANRDAALFFAGEILPRLRARFPKAQFRLVGRYDSEANVEQVRGRAGVCITGEVAEVAAELAVADVAVVPIRYGGGTRIKILEAFAHRLPVVTTTVGCEGLDVVAGEHLLVADDAESFAAACLALCNDPQLRARLVDAAEELWHSRYRWTTVAPSIVAAVDAALKA